jgi:hypothetical protein
VLILAIGKPLLSLVPLVHWDDAIEHLLLLGAEGGEVEIPPGRELLVPRLAWPAQAGEHTRTYVAYVSALLYTLLMMAGGNV